MATALVWLFFIHATKLFISRPVLFKTVHNKPQCIFANLFQRYNQQHHY